MKAPNKKLQRRKALLAFVFASSLVNQSLPVFAANENESIAEAKSSIGQRIANNALLCSELRAYYLICLARDYLAGCDKKLIETSFGDTAKSSSNTFFKNARRRKDFLDDLVLSSLTGKLFYVFEERSTAFRFRSLEEKKQEAALAKSAIDLAVAQLGTATDLYSKVSMYFVAARMYNKIGNGAGSSKCNSLIEDVIKTCEANQKSDAEQLEASCVALNLLATSIIPITISDREPKNAQGERKIYVNPFTENEFDKSEKLRLRALALADRLSTEDHLRRKAHRDMALWYEQLGKKSLAEKEKQTLFDLVGIHDEKILYPVDGACGHLRWWTLQTSMYAVDCGMG